ncbi:MAG: prepilin-type N-terminal cleavage/methylation domain-containing protein [Acidobacteriota bacterium]|nr:prepilin-type N-terminal cleavage/methylation domain-containing protein [Acidobacteriota bacterium]
MTRKLPASIRPGFTIIEVLAALAILSIALVLLIRGQTQSLNNVRKVANYERAVFITENNLHWTFLDLNEVDDWREYASQTVEDGPYRCRVTVDSTEMERSSEVEMVMLKIIAETTWQEGNREQSFRLETWYFWGEPKQ